jgi:putative ABC transport system permease protein
MSAAAIKIIGTALGAGVLPPAVIFSGLAMAVLLALISGLPPAVRAQRLNIVDALAVR